METLNLTVEGMKCGGCANGLKTALLAQAGVQSASADAKQKSVTIEFDSAQISADQLKQAIHAQGYKVV